VDAKEPLVFIHRDSQ